MRARVLFVLGVLAVYAGVFLAFDGLQFEVGKGELHFWPTTLEFSRSLFPSVELLRGYNELDTPLPFMMLGLLEHVFGGGIAVGRALNTVLSIAVVLLIGTPRNGGARTRIACAVGSIAFPYYLGVSTYLYTDIIAACVAPAVAAATLLGWVAFFGGLAPSTAVRAQELKSVRLLRIYPDHALYLLTCPGACFVIPELVDRTCAELGLPWLDLNREGASAGVDLAHDGLHWNPAAQRRLGALVARWVLRHARD